MEWGQEQLKFIEDNKGLLEKEDYDEFWLRAYSQLIPSQARHLMLGVAVASGLVIELVVYKESRVSMYVLTKTGNPISIFGRAIFGEQSDIELCKICDSVLKTLGTSTWLNGQVVGLMKVIRR